MRKRIKHRIISIKNKRILFVYLLFTFGILLFSSLLFAFSYNNKKGATGEIYKTYYVRTDGGTDTQCNGLYDSPYTGIDQNCAWSHPSIALPYNSNSSRIKGGDTLMIGHGNYEISAIMAPIPGGYEGYPTRILGEGWETGDGLLRPQLWGSKGVKFVLSLSNSSQVDVEQNSDFMDIRWLEITDRSTCGINHYDSSFRCQPGGDYAENGVYALKSSNVYMQGVNVHGLGGTGFYTAGLENWLVEDTKSIANLGSGWDFDAWGRGIPSAGNLVFKNLSIEWNGCVESTLSDKKPLACMSMFTNENGSNVGAYADGIGTPHTGGNWVFEDSQFMHNTQDGLDLLYLDTGDSNITLNRVRAEGNAGNQVKINANAEITNSIIVGNCNFFETYDSVYYYPTPAEGFSGFWHCRGGDSALILSQRGGETSKLSNNLIHNYNGTVISVYPRSYYYDSNNDGRTEEYYPCSDGNDGVNNPGETPDASMTLIARNNILYGGGTDIMDPIKKGAKILDTYYVDYVYCPNFPVKQYVTNPDGTFKELLSDYNILQGVQPGDYGIEYSNNGPGKSYITNHFGLHDQRGAIDLRFTNAPSSVAEENANFAYNFVPLVDSPTINKLSGVGGVDFPTVDILKNIRPEPNGNLADIGPYEYSSAGGRPVIASVSAVHAYPNLIEAINIDVINADTIYWQPVTQDGNLFINAQKYSAQISSTLVGTYKIKILASNSSGDADMIFDFIVHKLADINGDNSINFTDFSVLLSSWGTPSNPMANIVRTGTSATKVDFQDFSVLLSKWGG